MSICIIVILFIMVLIWLTVLYQTKNLLIFHKLAILAIKLEKSFKILIKINLSLKSCISYNFCFIILQLPIYYNITTTSNFLLDKLLGTPIKLTNIYQIINSHKSHAITTKFITINNFPLLCPYFNENNKIFDVFFIWVLS